MHGWLAITLNDTSIFQGFHDWHQDGPANVGRYHKAFVMVSKNRSTARPTGGPALNHANAYERYERNCQILGSDSWEELANPLSCTGKHAHLAPGDVLFFREDVHHRTQDTQIDRVALIIDIHRLPLRDAPDVRIGEGSEHVQSKRTNQVEVGNEVASAILKDAKREVALVEHSRHWQEVREARRLDADERLPFMPKARYRRRLRHVLKG